MSPLPSPEKLQRFARGAVRRVQRTFGGSVDHLAEDLMQFTLLCVYERPERGCGPKTLWQYALWGVGRWFGVYHSGRVRSPPVPLPDELPEVQGRPADERALALWRLQRVYFNLTAIQQEALLHILTHEDERRFSLHRRGNGAAPAARQAAVRHQNARRRAIERINRPVAGAGGAT